jgi:hypothetical protein
VCAGLAGGDALAQDDFNFPGRLRQLDPIIPGFEEPAPSFIKTAQAGFNFLALPSDARTAAMADAGVGLVGNAAGLFSNPAALAFLDGREVFFTQVQWIADMNYSVGGITMNLPGTGTLAVGFQMLDAGDFNGTAIDINPASKGYTDLGTFTTNNYALSLGYAMKITDRFSIGAAGKLAHQDLGTGRVLIAGAQTTVENSKNVVAFDVSTYFNTGFRNTVLAMTVQNFSSELQYQRERFELPRNIRMGLLIDLVSLTGGTPAPHHFDLAVDLSNPIDFDERFHTGLEYQYRRPGSSLGYAVRAGYKFNHDTEDYSAGGGLRWQSETGKGFRIDYAYRHFNGSFFSSVNVISGGVMF